MPRERPRDRGRWLRRRAHRWCCRDRDPGPRRHRADGRCGSGLGRSRRRCSNRGVRLLWTRYCAPRRRSGYPCGRAWHAGHKDRPRCRAGSRGLSVGRTPSRDTGRDNGTALHTALLGNAIRTAERRAWAGDPLPARKQVCQHTWLSPSEIQRESMLELVLQFKSVTPINRLFSFLDHDVIDSHLHFYGTVVVRGQIPPSAESEFLSPRRFTNLVCRE